MIQSMVSHAVVLVLAGIHAPPDDLESLARKYANRVNNAWSKAKGDAARGLAQRKIAEEFRAKAWKLVTKRAKAKDADAVWRFALQLDRDAGADDLAKHARSYQRKRPNGAHRAFVAEILAIHELEGADDAKVAEVIRRFDAEHEDSVLERGRLRAVAAEAAVERGDIGRAQKLYDQAIALPKSEAERTQEKRNHGSSWHKWWTDRRDGLELFKQGWGDLGGTDLNGKTWTVSDYHGDVLIVDYWASW